MPFMDNLQTKPQSNSKKDSHDDPSLKTVVYPLQT